MEGSVLRAEDRVRITVQLLDASDTHLWAEHYEGDLRDVLKLQSEVARSVAQAVKVKLSPLEDSRLSGQRPVNVESYELYLEGRELIESPSPMASTRAWRCSTRAAESIPTSALPYARLALAYASARTRPARRSRCIRALRLTPCRPLASTKISPMAMRRSRSCGSTSTGTGWALRNHSARCSSSRRAWRRRTGTTPGCVCCTMTTQAPLRSCVSPPSSIRTDPLWPSWLAWVQMLSGDYTSAEKELRPVAAIPGISRGPPCARPDAASAQPNRRRDRGVSQGR